MPYVYILECCDGSYYTGSTINLETRLWEHENGLGANYTADKLPVRLVYFEESPSIAQVFKREKQIQGWSRKKKQALIAHSKELLHALAKCQNGTSHEASAAARQDSSGSQDAVP